LYFDGFVRKLESLVDEKVDGSAQKLSYLQRNASKRTEGCARMHPQRSYDESRRQLFEQYGQFYITASGVA